MIAVVKRTMNAAFLASTKLQLSNMHAAAARQHLLCFLIFIEFVYSCMVSK